MADRPMTSTSRAGRPRTRSRSEYIPSHIPVASKSGKHRTASAQRIPTKGKGTDKGKKATKKSNKVVIVVTSDFPITIPINLMRYLQSYYNSPIGQWIPPLKNNKNQVTPQMIQLKNIPQMLQQKT